MKMRAAALFLLVAWAAGCSRPAALGPKDGRDLAPHDPERVKLGQAAPDFTLEDHSGRALTLSSFRGKYVILVFYRGHW